MRLLVCSMVVCHLQLFITLQFKMQFYSTILGGQQEQVLDSQIALFAKICLMVTDHPGDCNMHMVLFHFGEVTITKKYSLVSLKRLVDVSLVVDATTHLKSLLCYRLFVLKKE